MVDNPESVSVELPASMGTQALKLKLDVSTSQATLLNEAFWKWAAIAETCGKMKSKEEWDNWRSRGRPENWKGVWFNKTQLTQIAVDLKTVRDALTQQKLRAEYDLDRLIKRRDERQSILDKPELREYSPKRKDLFRPKSWGDAGLKTKYHTPAKYQKDVRELQKKIDRKDKTIKKMERGQFSFKPTRLCLWKDSIKINFTSQMIELSPFEPKEPLQIKVFLKPEQPLRGSSAKSSEWLHRILLDLAGYSIDSILFGLSHSEAMSAKARRPEKLAKLQTKKENKAILWPKKKKALEKLLGRMLIADETQILDGSQEIFAKTLIAPRSAPYLELLFKLANELLIRDGLICLNKYPVLLRRPIPSRKHKKISNLKPVEWEYYLQFGYEPIFTQKQPFKPETYLGVDRGISSLVAYSILEPKSKRFIFNRIVPGISQLKRHTRHLRKAIQALERKVRAQTNIHLHENQMKKQLRGVENAVDNCLHETSAEIVENAKKFRSEIVFEYLADMKQHGRKQNMRAKNLNYTLSLFDYAKLGQYVHYKARREGISVVVIDSAGTSQNCNKCLLAELESQKAYKRGINGNSKLGECTGSIHEHKYTIDADLNAARVIAICGSRNINTPRPFGQKPRFKSKATVRV